LEMLAVGWTVFKCDLRLYFHTASDAVGQRGHMIEMLVHGLVLVDFENIISKSLT